MIKNSAPFSQNICMICEIPSSDTCLKQWEARWLVTFMWSFSVGGKISMLFIVHSVYHATYSIYLCCLEAASTNLNALTYKCTKAQRWEGSETHYITSWTLFLCLYICIFHLSFSNFFCLCSSFSFCVIKSSWILQYFCNTCSNLCSCMSLKRLLVV